MEATFTRAGIATKFDVSQVASGVPRYERGRKQVLVQTAASNLLTYSSDFTNALWVKANITASANRLTEVINSGVHGCTRSDISVTSGLAYIFTVELQADSAYYVQLSANSVGFGSCYATFDLSAAGMVTASSGIISTKVVDLGDLWFRCSITIIATSTTSSSGPALLFTNNNPVAVLSPSYSAIGQSVNVRKAQFEQGWIVTEHLPTTSAPASRALLYSNSQDQAIMIEVGTTNLFTANQAGIETDLAGINIVNCTNVRDTSIAWQGAASLKSTCSTGGTFGPYMTTGTASVAPGDNITASCYIFGLISKSVRIAIEWKNASNGVISSIVGTTTPLSSSWQRLKLSGVAPALTDRVTITLYSTSPGVIGDIFWSDGWQVEKRVYATSWVVGTRPNELVTAPASLLNTVQGAVACWVYNSKVDTTIPHTIFHHRSALYKDYIILQKASPAGNWRFLTTNNAATDASLGPNRRELSVADTTAIGWVHVAATWSAAEIALFINGVKVAFYLNPPIPSVLGANCYIGCESDNFYFWDSLIDDLHIFNKALTPAEVAQVYGGQA